VNPGRWAIGCLAAAAGGSAAVALPVMAAPRPAGSHGAPGHGAPGHGPTTTVTMTVAPSGTTVTSTTVTPPSPATTHPSAPTATAGSPAVPLRVGFKGSTAVLLLGWKFNGDVSVVSSVHISGFPRDATLSASCRGASGCPLTVTRRDGRARTVHRSVSADGGQLHRFIDNLLKLSYHADDRVVFTVSEPGKPAVSTAALVRNGRKPVIRQLG
jgi:hypothetical protein